MGGKRKTVLERKYEIILGDYSREEANRGMSVQTVHLNGQLVKRLFEYLDAKQLAFNEMAVKDAYDFLKWIRENRRQDGKEYSKGGINNFLEAAKSLFAYLKRRRAVMSNPFKGLERIRHEKRIPRNLLKEKGMNRFLEGLLDWDVGTIYGRKNRYLAHVVCELQYSTGMRIAEVAGLAEEDIDFSRGIVTVRQGKGARQRHAFLNEYAKGVLWVYVSRMRKLIFGDRYRRRDTLFRLSTTRLQNKMNAVLAASCLRMGIVKLTTHSFRHAFGFHFLRSGCDIRFIQALLGHENLQTTEIYTYVEKDDLKRVLDTFHPRKWRKEP